MTAPAIQAWLESPPPSPLSAGSVPGIAVDEGSVLVDETVDEGVDSGDDSEPDVAVELAIELSGGHVSGNNDGKARRQTNLSSLLLLLPPGGTPYPRTMSSRHT